MSNRRKSLPNVSPKVDPQIRPLLAAMKEIMDTGEGVRGDPLDRKLTLRDLLDSGIGKMRPGSGGRGAGGLIPGDNAPPPNLATPPAPTNFEVDGALGFIFLSWDNPRLAYSNHGYTEVWRHTEDNLANAALHMQVYGSMDADPNTLYGTTYYYWIRFISSDDVSGPFNSPNGTPGAESEDPQIVLERIRNSITESELHSLLNDRIDLIDGPPELAGSVAQQVFNEAVARAQAVQDEADDRGEAISLAYTELEEYADSQSASAIDLTQLVSVFGNNIADSLNFTITQVDADLAITTSFNSLNARVNDAEDDLLSKASLTEIDSVIADATGASALSLAQLSSQHGGNTAAIQVQQESIDGLSASYSVKIDNNGAVSGFGLSSETVNGDVNSFFLVNADTIGFMNSGLSYPVTIRDEGTHPGVNAGQLGIDFGNVSGLDLADVEHLSITGCDQNINGIYNTTGFASGLTATVDKRPGADSGPYTASIYANGLYRLTGLSRSGTTATATSANPHGFSVGQAVDISRADQSEWNGKWEVASVPNDTTFTFTVPSSLSASPSASIKSAITTIPFAIEDGKVAIDAAYIVNLVVTDADIDDLSVGKITGLEGAVLDISVNSLEVEDLQGDVNSTVSSWVPSGLGLGSTASNYYREVTDVSIPSQTRPRIPLLFQRMVLGSNSAGNYRVNSLMVHRTSSGTRTDLDPIDSIGETGAGSSPLFPGSSVYIQWDRYADTGDSPTLPTAWGSMIAGREIGFQVNGVWHYGRISSRTTETTGVPGGTVYAYRVFFSFTIARGSKANLASSPSVSNERLRMGSQMLFQDVVGRSQHSVYLNSSSETEVNNYVMSLPKTQLAAIYTLCASGGGTLEEGEIIALLMR